MTDTIDAIRMLAALAQETRLAVFRLLVQVGPEGMAASAIADQVGITPSSLSFHFKELSNARLLSQRQEDRFVYYAVNIEAMNDLMAYLTDNCCGGNPCGPAAGTRCAPAKSKKTEKA
jgi:DNA-binding transcriptional ArsR family regulator